MTRGVRLYLVGSIVLVSLAGCGRGFFQAEREPWRAEAEAACLKSGAVKESADIVRIDPISGPGMCGAEFPLKVAAIGEGSSSYGFADEELRPPGSIGNQPRWPVTQPQSNYPRSRLSAAVELSRERGAPAFRLWRVFRPGVAQRARCGPAGRRDRFAARRHRRRGCRALHECAELSRAAACRLTRKPLRSNRHHA